jgi:hypothetical protein
MRVVILREVKAVGNETVALRGVRRPFHFYQRGQESRVGEVKFVLG